MWVGLVPLMLACMKGRAGRGFWLSYVCGILFFCCVFNWSFEIPGYSIWHQIFLALYLGLYFAVFGWVFSFLSNRFTVFSACLAAPSLWVCLEYMRCNASILSLPWPFLSHSQYMNLPVIQIAKLTGAYGVSYAIVAVNAALAGVLFHVTLSRGNPNGCSGTASTNRSHLLMGGTVSIVACMLLYGHWELNRPLPDKKVRLSVLQGNVSQAIKKHPRKNADVIMQTYSELTQQAGRERPDLIVWPEASTPGLVLKNMGLLTQLVNLIRSQQTHFVIGSSEYPKFNHSGDSLGRAGNTALFLSPRGKVLGQYLKIILLPFGEYIPYENTIAWPRFLINTQRSWDLPGHDIVLFDLDGVPFGVIICWENAFPGLVRQFVDRGARFMINITNEGWFGETEAPYQFLAMSVFRAVENGVALVRAANTGVSCFIGPTGNIEGRVRAQGKDIYIDGHLTRSVTITDEPTFYTRFGDLFVFGSMVVVGMMLIGACVYRSPAKKA